MLLALLCYLVSHNISYSLTRSEYDVVFVI